MAVVVAYVLKFKMGKILFDAFSIHVAQIYTHTQIEPYLSVSGLIVLVWVSTFYFVGVYQLEASFMPFLDESLRIIKGAILATIQIMVITFLFKFFPGSRYVIMYSLFCGIFMTITAHLFIHRLELFFLKKGIGTRGALIIGADAFGQDVAEKLFLYPGLALKYIGSLDENPPEKIHFHLRDTFNFLGRPDTFRKYSADVIFVTKSNLDPAFLSDLVSYCDREEVDLWMLSNAAVFMAGAIHSQDFDGIPFITQVSANNLYIEHAMKWLMDKIGSLLGLILLSPLFLVIAISIKWVSSDGPVFYVQERIGKDDKKFGMIKFRTMIPNAEKNTGPMLVNEKGEDRYISIGEFLRKTSLDELPQLLNVLKGDMSLIGPRPERAFFIEKIERDFPHFSLRHKVKGGITGLAQINGRSVLTRRPDHKLKYDLYYIKNWSLLLDIKILIKTISVVSRAEEAY